MYISALCLLVGELELPLELSVARRLAADRAVAEGGETHERLLVAARLIGVCLAGHDQDVAVVMLEITSRANPRTAPTRGRRCAPMRSPRNQSSCVPLAVDVALGQR